MACHKNSVNPKPSLLAGIWKEGKNTDKSFIDGQLAVEFVNMDGIYSVQFKDDGTGAFMHWDTTDNFKYTLSGNSLLLTPNPKNAVYSIDSLTATSFILHKYISHTSSGEIYDEYYTGYYIKE